MKIASVFIFLSLSLYANDFLDRPYKNLIHPKKSSLKLKKDTSKSDTLSIIENQSSVKAQLNRGTCSMFSTTAYIESYLISSGLSSNEIDLSEEWLQYTSLNNAPTDGSSAANNLNAILNYGIPREEMYPYIGEDWKVVNSPLSDQRCLKLTPEKYNSCLIIHRNPDFLLMEDKDILNSFFDVDFINAREEAKDFKEIYLGHVKKNQRYFISEVSEIKNILNDGRPVILEVDFFYGAWNHSKADIYGIPRDIDHWNKGIVTYPEKDSLDYEISKKYLGGHSVLVVGYDDNIVIERKVKMKDGSIKKFSYKGVYYFKNSWGTNNFAKESTIDGKKTPGYGTMVQGYAEDYGAFYQLPGLF